MSATEGAGKITNYLAMGLPVVAFDTPVSREMLGDLGVYARMGDSVDLAQRIVGLLGDERRSADLAQRGRDKAVREHSWELGGQQIAAIYARAFARRAGHPLPLVPTVINK
jgi:glycosyltransferase involved in cell wall biosynthesis